VSEAASKRGWRRVRWGLPLLLGFVVAAFLQWGIHDGRWIPTAASLVRSHFDQVGSYADVIREQADQLRSRVDAQVASYERHLRGHAERIRAEAAAFARAARGPTTTPRPVRVASVATEVPTAETEADLGMSYEDPLAPLAFLTKRMEEARSAAKAENRRAAAARRQAVALARRVEADAPREPAAPATDSAPTPVHKNGLPKGVARVDLNGDGLAAAGTNGAGYAGNGANGHSGNGDGASATGAAVPYPAVVPHPPNGNGGSMAVQPAATASAGRVQAASHASGAARVGSPVTIGEPMRDVPPSARLLANAGGPGGRGVPRPPGQRVAQASGTGPVPPPPSAGFADDDDEEPALIGPERAPCPRDVSGSSRRSATRCPTASGSSPRGSTSWT
jgi:hypothetical protein